jgi:hypothetical protein
LPESLYGPLTSTWTVEQAVIASYRNWIGEYLAETERKAGLQKGTLPRLQAEHSIHGGVDFETWRQDLNPEIIVVVEPYGEADRQSSVYGQTFAVQVGCMWAGSFGSELAELPEDEARMIAGYFGAALMLLVHTGVPSLAGAQEVVLINSPTLNLPYPEKRSIMLAELVYHIPVVPIIEPNAGVPQAKPTESPYYGGEPEAKAKELTAVQEGKIKPTVQAVTVKEEV